MTFRSLTITLPLLAAAVAMSSVPALAGRVLPPDQAQQKKNDDKDKEKKDSKKGKAPDGQDGKKNDARGKGKDGGPPRKDAGPGPGGSGGPGKPDRDRAKNDNFKKNEDFKKKQEADQARQNAIKKQQLEAERARDKALQQKRDADLAREKAARQKQIEAQQAKERAKEYAKQPQPNPIEQQHQMSRDAARLKAEREKAARDARASKFDRAKADEEFERARREAQRKRDDGPGLGSGRPATIEKWRDGSDRKFEALRRERKERTVGNRDLIIEPDKRVIVRKNDRAFIRHDESSRLQRTGREVRRERRKDGTWMIVTMGLAGALIYSLQDDDGRVLRRSRKDRDGRELVLFDNRRYYRAGSQFGPDYDYDNYIDLPPPDVRIPRDKYIVDYDRASLDDIYDALNAPPIERLDRGYSLDEVRRSYRVLERMRRVDLDTITFEFGSWEVEPDQYGKLERIANALRRILDRSPDEIFLIEGHTDAVGSDIDNLSLSDRRAETVAVILTETFGIPPENLTTQGYGEQYLKEPTDGPSWINRRVSLRRITPLLSREGWDDPWDQSAR
jgi:outer membrane protein OmpA-like peptidoglycan-associated protein